MTSSQLSPARAQRWGRAWITEAEAVAELIRVRPRKPLICMLLVTSSPSDAATLDVRQERQLIEKAWGPTGDIEVTALERPTLAMLNETLEQNAYQILHFVGHGSFDSAQRHGPLIFEDSHGTSQPIAASALATIPRVHREWRSSRGRCHPGPPGNLLRPPRLTGMDHACGLQTNQRRSVGTSGTSTVRSISI